MDGQWPSSNFSDVEKDCEEYGDECADEDADMLRVIAERKRRERNHDDKSVERQPNAGDAAVPEYERGCR
jgi:hypothetical protein